MYKYNQFSRRKLPHVHSPGATLFVTFRLAGSIPQTLIKLWAVEKQKIMQQAGVKNGREEEMLLFHRKWFVVYDEELHTERTGPTWLKDPAVADSVKRSIHAHDGDWYKLHAYTVMSNHAHVLLTPHLNEHDLIEKKNAEGNVRFESLTPPLSEIMRSIKGTSARESNIILGRSGRFWEAESYDTELKGPEAFWRAVKYVLRNPVKAGIVEKWQDYSGSWCTPEIEKYLSTD